MITYKWQICPIYQKVFDIQISGKKNKCRNLAIIKAQAIQINTYLEEMNLRSLSSNQTEFMPGPVT